MFINISPSDGIMIDKKVNRGKYPCVDQFMWMVALVWYLVFIAQSSWSVIIGV